MIYLIDDTPVQMLDRFLKVYEFKDCFRRIENLPIDDVPSLAGASCVLIHSSYGNSAVKRRILDVLDCGEVAPVVLFSDGDNEEATFNGDNYIISIKKSVLYSRLPRFLKDFRKNKSVNLRILSGEQPVAVKNSVPIAKNNVFSEFFSRVSLDLSPNKEDNPNSLCVICIGREGMNAVATKIGGLFIKFNANSLRGEDQRLTDIKIHDYLTSGFRREAKAFVLDTDSDPSLIMLLAMHIRLTETLPGNSRYAPIIFISDFPMEKLIVKSSFAQIFMTNGAYLCHRSEVEGRISTTQPLDEASFQSDFLDKINIPAPKGSNHSLANQWGASRLYMIISGEKAKKDVFKDFQDIHKRLYFKYICHKIPASGPNSNPVKPNYQVRGAVGKRILLIDDEAEKGWTKSLSLIFPSARFSTKEDVIAETVMDYDGFSARAKNIIEERDYDLILLDLRLGGIREDFVVESEQMSGYKVLQRIKQLNKGRQIIVLTASNKAWNLKALMNGTMGADGYFVKESPEYEFSNELSSANLRSLIKDIERCLNQGYLRDFWPFIRDLDRLKGNLAGEVRAQMEIAYEMAAKAETADDFHYAFLALYQSLEIVTSKLTDWQIDTQAKDSKLLYLPGNSYAKEIVAPSDNDVIWSFKPLTFHTVPKNGIFPQKEKLSALYLQTWGKKDNGILFLMDQLIAIRNAIIHPENAKLFETVAPIREEAFLHNLYFRDESYIFGTHVFKALFREAASKGFLFSDSNGRPVLHIDVTNSQLGIRILLACLKDILPLIEQ